MQNLINEATENLKKFLNFHNEDISKIPLCISSEYEIGHNAVCFHLEKRPNILYTKNEGFELYGNSWDYVTVTANEVKDLYETTHDYVLCLIRRK